MNKRLRKKKGLLISYQEMWSLDYTLAKYILPRLKKFKEVCCGYPCPLTEDEYEEILNKMIWSFDYIVKEEIHTIEEKEKLDKQCQEGLNLFAEYFRSLWL